MKGNVCMSDVIKVAREAEALKILRMVERLIADGTTAKGILEALEAYVEAHH